MSKWSRICYILRVRQMLRTWRKKAAVAAARSLPSDVPAGHVAVTVGTTSRRFVVPASHLNHPLFKKLLLKAEEEYGFGHSGPLAIPCEETMFEEILRFVSRSESGRWHSARFLDFEDFQKCCRGDLEIHSESRPILRAVSDESYW